MSAYHQEHAGAATHPATPALRNLFLLLASLLVAEAAAHITLLRLPYYWDEAGYYIPAAYDLFRTGSPIPYSTLTNAHPPGLSLYLAAAWKLFGFAPLTTRLAMCLAAAVALAAVYRIALGALGNRAAAGAVVLLTAIYPVWFAQSTLAHADMLAAAATLWGLRFALRARREAGSLWAAAACFTAAALTKEIAIGTPLALACWALRLGAFPPGRGANARERLAALRRSAPQAAVLASPAVPLAAWFGFHRWRTGFAFGNPEYLRYNATATLSPMRILLALGHRVLHLSAHLNLFVPVAIATASLLLPPLADRAQLRTGLLAQLWVVIVANALLFSVLGGALLTRYLLPVYPLVLLLAVSAVYRRFGHWFWFPALATVAFAAGLLLPAPYRIAPEDTLAYRDAILLEQQAIGEVVAHYPHATVLSAWPVTDELRKPELGYVQVPVAVVPVDNFSLPVLSRLVEPGGQRAYSVAIVFSTKYEPASPLWGLGAWNERQQERYFDLHHDLRGAAVAKLLGGSVVWQRERGGQQAAVLRFEHPQLAGSYNQERTGAACTALKE